MTPVLAAMLSAFAASGPQLDESDTVRVAELATAHETEHLQASPDDEIRRLRAQLRNIIETQQRIRDGRRDDNCNHPGPYPAELLSPDPRIGTVPTIFLKRGETATVKHTISWRQYDEDTLPIWFRASDPSLTVPDKLRLEFEKHPFKFQYEIKAGDKMGEFTVTLTPAPGNVVEVKVVVK